MELALQYNGKIYKGWENIKITKSMLSIADTFQMSIKPDTIPNLNNNDEVVILKDGEVFLVGYLDDIDEDLSDTRSPTRLSGRSRAMDIVDCNIVKNKQYANLNALQIINDLIKDLNIKCISSLKLSPLKTFNTEVGETFFNAINRLCKQINILPTSTRDGNIELIKNGKITTSTTITKFKKLKFQRKFNDRFSQYTYKKESSTKDVSDGTVKDTQVGRYRPFVAVNSEDKTNVDMANWKKNNTISGSIFLDGSLVGWEENINTIVKIQTPLVNGSFLIKEITYTKDDNGTISDIVFVDKDLFNDK